MARTLKVTLVKSLIGLSPRQEATVKALGLRRIRQVVEHEDTPTLRGMIRAVSFCLSVKECEAQPEASRAKMEMGASGASPGAAQPEASRAVAGEKR